MIWDLNIQQKEGGVGWIASEEIAWLW